MPESLASTAVPEPGSPLRALERLAGELGAEPIAAQARDLSARLEEGRYYVACVGQFKRGKSSLINALVGESLLPCGVVPVTSALTILRYGPERGARVRFADGHEQPIAPGEVGAYVSESENPENRKGVRAVEVFLPSPLLAEGMCLVDTPGVGSVFTGNAAVTRGFVPHIDAALVVIGADPPISGEEVALVQDIGRGVEHLVFALNKADRLSAHERSEGVRFAREVLSRSLGRLVGPVHQVSALERIERGPTRDWAALQASLESLSRKAGSDLVPAAESRGVARLARSLLHELDERRDALVRPVEESERRIETLRAYVSSAERALQDLSVLLVAEEARTSRELRDSHAAHFPGAQAAARGELEQALRRIERRGAMRREGFRLAQQIARRVWEAWRAETEPVAEETYRRVTGRFVEHANEFLARLARSGEPGSESLPRSLGPEAGFRVRSRFYYTEVLARTFAPLQSLADRLRTRERAVRSVLRQVGAYLDELVEANTSRISNDLVERVAESRALLESDIRASLRQVSTVAERALARARAQRAEGETSVREELQRLESLRRRTESLLSAT
ncbi:MAG TPA: dynamin family protein [Anaeromyxobacteraceae bacterium]|nr:dynamin family protein [Anaeromyxobacteraceae bacterium]